MLNRIGRFIVRIADLAEAEGRLASKGLVRAAVVLLLAGAAVTLGVVAVVALCGAFYLTLADTLPPSGALALSGLLMLAVAAGTAWAAHNMYSARPAPPQNSPHDAEKPHEN